jgi:hypothetical protein
MSIMKSSLHLVLSAVLAGTLAACVTAPATPSTDPKSLQKAEAQADAASASLMSVGYRNKRAGEADQFIMPPERFVVTAIDGIPLQATTTVNRALTISPGSHKITISARGGFLFGENTITVQTFQNRVYHLTGWLNNHGTPAFIVWIEDSETGRPASPKMSIFAARDTKIFNN